MVDINDWTSFDIDVEEYEILGQQAILVKMDLKDGNNDHYRVTSTLGADDLATDEDLARWLVAQINQDGIGFIPKDLAKIKKIKVTAHVDGGELIFDSVS